MVWDGFQINSLSFLSCLLLHFPDPDVMAECRCSYVAFPFRSTALSFPAPCLPAKVPFSWQLKWGALPMERMSDGVCCQPDGQLHAVARDGHWENGVGVVPVTRWDLGFPGNPHLEYEYGCRLSSFLNQPGSTPIATFISIPWARNTFVLEFM